MLKPAGGPPDKKAFRIFCFRCCKFAAAFLYPAVDFLFIIIYFVYGNMLQAYNLDMATNSSG